MNGLSLSAWVVAILGAFAVSVEMGIVAMIGVLGQWMLNAPKKINTGLASAIIVVVALGAYKGLHWATPLDQAFVQAAALWILAALGSGSLAGKTGGAPATNSR